jgi:cobyrinic acid a,c-diamide synthase
MNSTFCKAVFLSAPASGQGKTTVTAALARLLTRHGKTVRIFKTGPDYLDPQVLEQASGQPVQQLDMWMAGEDWCQHQFYQAATVADIILVEGAMGLFDGTPSSADLAARFQIPVALIMDVKGMAQTVGALATGLANYRDDCRVIGLVANNCASERHRSLIEESLPESLPLITTLARSEQIALPERHLGLVQASEVRDELETRFEAAADSLDEKRVLAWVDQLTEVAFQPAEIARVEQSLNGKTIAIAKDEAFSFIYDSNLQLLSDMGATLKFFSPLHDQQLPEADALWLPGGYPELHAQALAQNQAMLQQIRHFHQHKKPMLAECGGFLYCLQSLTDLQDQTYPMLGLLTGSGAMRGKRGCQGMQTAPLPEGHVRGHAHHRARSDVTESPLAHAIRQRHPAPGEAVYRQGSLTAGFLHLFFPSNPEAIAALFSGIHLSDSSLTFASEINHVN